MKARGRRRIEAAELRVRRARVHPRSAVLELAAELEGLPPGPLTVELLLDPGADLHAARARASLGRGDAARPLDVLDLRPGLEAVGAEQVDRREAELGRRREALERFAALGIERLRASFRSSAPPLDAWTTFLRLFRDERAKIARAEAELARERAGLEAGGGNRGVGLRLHLPLGGATPLAITLEVPTTSLGWRPRHEIRARSAGPGAVVELGLLAEISDRTGHRFEDTELLLLDAESPPPGPIPELNRVVVSGFQGPPLSGTVAEELVPAPRAPRGPALRFRPPAPVTLPRGAGPSRLALFERHNEGTTRLELDLDRPGPPRRILAFSAPTALPAGEADLFWEGSYVARGRLEGARAGQTIELELGPVEAIRAEGGRRRAPPRRSRGTNRLEHRFETEVRLESVAERPLDIELAGRVPVAGSSDVEVEIELLPEGTAVDPATGHLHALVRLPAGGRRTFRAAYSVHAPRSVVVDDPEGT